MGKRAIKPLVEGDDLAAKREAVLKPRLLGEFLNKYNGSSLPKDGIAFNVLEDMDVPPKKTGAVYNLILASAQSLDMLRVIKDKQYVDLTGVNQLPDSEIEGDETVQKENSHDNTTLSEDEILSMDSNLVPPVPERSNRKVIITHGKNTAFIEPIKKLLRFGELIPIVSVEKQTVSKPVPEKVMDDMRSCGAAIIHVVDELKLIDKDANEHVIINPNVLIEIGAAMALYGRRFILLVKEGVDLPSNLQGLYEVRYKGDTEPPRVCRRLHFLRGWRMEQ